MLKIALVAIVMTSSFAFAQQKSDLGELEVGADAQNSSAYLSQTDAEVIAHINKEIAQKCDDHGCTFVSRVDQKKGWTITFNAGNGQSNNASGSTYYIGSGTASQGNQNYYGVSISYTNMTCTSDFKIQEDDFTNNIGRALQERENNSVLNMKPLSTDMKFIQLIKLEIYKQLAAGGCLR
ncbi:MAG: hypothetical protein H7256_03260 [Bdellovibrio sp.]|nr:hypothetical protein [Bdellovibrio sp.]